VATQLKQLINYNKNRDQELEELVEEVLIDSLEKKGFETETISEHVLFDINGKPLMSNNTCSEIVHPIPQMASHLWNGME
jgi:hypothetical protein